MFRVEIELENPAELMDFFKDPTVQAPLLRLSCYHAARGALAKAIERNQTEMIRTLCPVLVEIADDLPLLDGVPEPLVLDGEQTR